MREDIEEDGGTDEQETYPRRSNRSLLPRMQRLRWSPDGEEGKRFLPERWVRGFKMPRLKVSTMELSSRARDWRLPTEEKKPRNHQQARTSHLRIGWKWSGGIEPCPFLFSGFWGLLEGEKTLSLPSTAKDDITSLILTFGLAIWRTFQLANRTEGGVSGEHPC